MMFAVPYEFPKGVGLDTRYRDQVGNPVLLISEVLDFLSWLESHSKRIVLVPGVALQALCGLQLQEVLRLTWDKVNLPDRYVIIEGRVKNRWRIRKIPIPRKVGEILKNISPEPLDPAEKVIREYADGYRGYSKLLHRALHRWRTGIDLAPKDFRNTIITEAFQRGWNTYLTERYVGHAPRSIAEIHYFGDRGDRLFELFQKEIVEKIEMVIENCTKLHDEGKVIDLERKIGNV